VSFVPLQLCCSNVFLSRVGFPHVTRTSPSPSKWA
jgi:hypothetical protein